MVTASDAANGVKEQLGTEATLSAVARLFDGGIATQERLIPRGDRGRITGGTGDPMAKIRPIDADNGWIDVGRLRFATLCEPGGSGGVFLADAMDFSSQGFTKPPD